MFLLKRISPFMAAIINLVALEWLLQKADYIYFLPVVSWLLVLFFLTLIVFGKMTFKAGSRLGIIFSLLIVSSVLSLLFVESFIIKHLLVVLVSLILFLYLEYIFLFIYLPEKYKTYSLENIYNFVNLLTYLLALISIFGFILFMNFSFWWALLVVAILTFLSHIIFLRAVKIEVKKAWTAMAVSLIVILEIFTLLAWLPFNFYMKALMLTTVYYLLNGVIRLVLADNFKIKSAIRLVFIFIGVWLLCLLTARWN